MKLLLTLFLLTSMPAFANQSEQRKLEAQQKAAEAKEKNQSEQRKEEAQQKRLEAQGKSKRP